MCTGFDVSPDLIDVARARHDVKGVTFAVADMGTAALPDVPFDRLASRFGVMFFTDPPAAFANLATWLAAGRPVRVRGLGAGERQPVDDERPRRRG